MSPKFKTFKTAMEVESVDIPTMYEMSDEDYRSFVRDGGLIYVDHHDILRSSPAGYPIATTREQFDILIEELQRLREKLVTK